MTAPAGERQQDNDLIVIRDVGAAAKFDTHFERMWQAAQPMIEFGPAARVDGEVSLALVPQMFVSWTAPCPFCGKMCKQNTLG